MRYRTPLFAVLFFSLFLSVGWAQGETDLKAVQESQGRVLADQVNQLNLLRQEVQELKGFIEETKHASEEEIGKNAKLVRDFDLRITGMEERLSLDEMQLKEFLSEVEKSEKIGKQEYALYKKALMLVNTQHYKEAAPLFDQLLKKYPKSPLADNSQYWKGEILFALKSFPEAVLEFQKVVKSFPKSTKVPGAVLKQGECFFELKQYEDAKAFFQKVIKEFAASEEAIQAREWLQKVEAILVKPPAATEPPPKPSK